MDRLIRGRLASCGLGLIVATAGCRSTTSPVPPGRQFTTEGASAAGFGAEPHPATGPGAPLASPGSAAPMSGPYGPAPTVPYGPAPTTSSYGPAPMTLPPSVSGPADPAAIGTAGYGPAPSAAAGAPALQMNPTPGTAPTIPAN